MHLRCHVHALASIVGLLQQSLPLFARAARPDGGEGFGEAPLPPRPSGRLPPRSLIEIDEVVSQRRHGVQLQGGGKALPDWGLSDIFSDNSPLTRSIEKVGAYGERAREHSQDLSHVASSVRGGLHAIRSSAEGALRVVDVENNGVYHEYKTPVEMALANGTNAFRGGQVGVREGGLRDAVNDPYDHDDLQVSRNVADDEAKEEEDEGDGDEFGDDTSTGAPD